MSVDRVALAPSWLLGRANARAQRLLIERFAVFGLRPLHYRVLAALDQHRSLSQAELGRHLLLDRKDVATSVDALAGRGLVARSSDARDGRRVIVSLTMAAQELLPDLDAALNDVQDRLLEPLTPVEANRLRELLSKIAHPEIEAAGTS